MDSEAFKDRVQRLTEVNEEIAKLDPAIRAAAFELLSGLRYGRSRSGRHGQPGRFAT